ncbi:MAG: hypothetical protein QNJ77_11940 [Acidimicrobiia bacterium]|nr:hypothetical protein [Acidimicrobiia bacterium]
MATATSRLLPTRWTNLHRLVLSVAAILLLYWSHEWIRSFRDNITVSHAVNAHLWRWFVAAGLALLAGLLFGTCVRDTPPGLPFDWKRPVAIGTVPLFLAMTWPPMVWGWPGYDAAGPLWSLRLVFFNDGYATAIWLVVGVAIASGFSYGLAQAGDG